MRRLFALTLLAGFALISAPSAQAATSPYSTLVVTYTFDYTHEQSDQPGTTEAVHGVAVLHMHQTWAGTRYTCRFDPFTLHLIVNGRALARPMPAASCDDTQNTGQIFGSIDFAHLPTTPSTHWVDNQTMTVAEALQWPLDPTVAPYLSPVSWHTVYRSDGKTFVTAHGTGAMLENRVVAGGAGQLYAHLVGASGMTMRLHPQAGQVVPWTLTLHQEASLFVQVRSTTTGAGVSELAHSQWTATAHPL